MSVWSQVTFTMRSTASMILGTLFYPWRVGTGTCHMSALYTVITELHLMRKCQENQRNLTGPGRERRKQVMDGFDDAFHKAWKSKPMEVEDLEAVENYYQALGQDILSGRQRIGGQSLL